MFLSTLLDDVHSWRTPVVTTEEEPPFAKIFPINEPFRDYIRNSDSDAIIKYIEESIGEVAEVPFYVEALYECMESNNYVMAATLLQHWGNHPKFIDESSYPFALIVCSHFFPLSVVKWLSTTPLLSNADDTGNKRHDLVPMLYEKVIEISLLVEGVILGNRLRGCQMLESLYETAPNKGDDLTIEDIDRLLLLTTEDTPEVETFLTNKKRRLVGEAPVPQWVIEDPTIEYSTQAYAAGTQLYEEELKEFTQSHPRKEYPDIVIKDFVESNRVTQLLGPLNVSNFYITDPDHPCLKTGGCRMQYCIHNDYTEEEESEDVSYLPTDLTAGRWFKGYCMELECLHTIAKPGSAIRLPLITEEGEGNGWFGCFCSQKCALSYVKREDSDTSSLTMGSDALLLVKVDPSVGIIQRKVGI